MTGRLPDRFEIRLPGWVGDVLRSRKEPLEGPEDRMRLAIDLARANVERGTGGPFGAAVFERDTGRLLAVGVNVVIPQHCSSAHAEIVALSLAQAARGSYTLGEGQAPAQLVTSVEPCAMCLGAIPWAGVAEVVSGATDRDAREVGFDEGSKPDPWNEVLEERGIRAVTGVLRDESRAVLQLYARSGRPIYNR